ncbi:hypothetical protein [Oleidesulfovibrio sp.]|uniref:hypothetical protein n=1 Tax=Oleidesulfovibrio sp. TaxID=2909707 RepID=UPI003A8C599B
MKFTLDEIQKAASESGIGYVEQRALLDRLNSLAETKEGLRGSTILLLLGSMLLLTALRWPIMGLLNREGSVEQFALSGIACALFYLIGYKLYFVRQRVVLGAVMFVLASVTVSIAVATTQAMVGGGNLPGILSSKVFLPALGTVIACAVTLRFARHLLLALPLMTALWGSIVDGLWYLDKTGVLPRLEEDTVACGVGAAFIVFSFVADHRFKLDYAFWGYFVGACSFWTGLVFLTSDTELERFVFFMTNLGLMCIGVILARYVFMVLGIIGLLLYMDHLAEKFLGGGIAYQIALCSVGLVVLYAGLYLHTHRKELTNKVKRLFPAWLMALRPAHRA